MPGDYKQKQIFHGWQLMYYAYQSIGVIYGDIGTSPLYVFSSVFGNNPPSREDTIGVLSLIIWSLLMMVTLKYVVIILHADNEGEGGTFSCYSLLSRYANITNRDPREAPLIQIERYETNKMHRSNLHVRDFLEKSKVFKNLLRGIGVLAVTMVMSDG
jgi:KUP system potassium uptake protein